MCSYSETSIRMLKWWQKQLIWRQHMFKRKLKLQVFPCSKKPQIWQPCNKVLRGLSKELLLMKPVQVLQGVLLQNKLSLLRTIHADAHFLDHFCHCQLYQKTDEHRYSFQPYMKLSSHAVSCISFHKQLTLGFQTRKLISYKIEI